MRIYLFVFLLGAVGCSEAGQFQLTNSSGPSIRGGRELKRNGIFPAQKSVVMLSARLNGNAGHLCSGVLVGANTVLTAAHCLENLEKSGAAVDVVFGPDHSSTSPRAALFKYSIHPSYKSNPHVFTYKFRDIDSQVTVTHSRRFDFALISFKGQLPSGFVPAAIATDPSFDLSGQTVVAYGGGTRGNARDVKSNEEYLAILSGQLKRGEFIVRESEFSGEDFYMIEGLQADRICGGDSGGPQFLLSAPVPTIVGVNSARFSEEQNVNSEACGPASLAMKVSVAADWILLESAKLERELLEK